MSERYVEFDVWLLFLSGQAPKPFLEQQTAEAAANAVERLHGDRPPLHASRARCPIPESYVSPTGFPQ